MWLVSLCVEPEPQASCRIGHPWRRRRSLRWLSMTSSQMRVHHPRLRLILKRQPGSGWSFPFIRDQKPSTHLRLFGAWSARWYRPIPTLPSILLRELKPIQNPKIFLQIWQTSRTSLQFCPIWDEMVVDVFMFTSASLGRLQFSLWKTPQPSCTTSNTTEFGLHRIGSTTNLLWLPASFSWNLLRWRNLRII